MKKHLLTFLLIFSMLLTAFLSNGQTVFLKFGPTFTRLMWESSYFKTCSPDIGIGYDAIAGVNYLKFKYFNLSSGIGFIDKEGSGKIIVHPGEYSQPYSYHVNTSMHFFTLNTTFNLKFPIKKIIEPFIFVGPRIDYLFSYSPGIFQESYHDFKINKLIYGILGGAGINFNVKRLQLGLVIDYYLDINKLVDSKKAPNPSWPSSYETEKIYEQTLTINTSIGFKF